MSYDEQYEELHLWYQVKKSAIYVEDRYDAFCECLINPDSYNALCKAKSDLDRYLWQFNLDIQAYSYPPRGYFDPTFCENHARYMIEVETSANNEFDTYQSDLKYRFNKGRSSQRSISISSSVEVLDGKIC